MTELLLIADGTNLTHRCWHATGGNHDPAPVARMLTSFVDEAANLSQAARILICFDGPDAGAHRHQLYPAYKAGRPDKADGLRNVLTELPGILASQGFTIHSAPGIEADDTLAHYAGQVDQDTVLLTSDKDAFSLLTHPRVTLLRVTNGGPAGWPLVTVDTLADHTGVGPDAYPLYSALKGDSSDNIPGVAGIGPTLAVKLANAHVTVEAFLDDLRANGPRTAAAIGAGRAGKLVTSLGQVEQALALTAALTAAYPVVGAPGRDQCTPANARAGRTDTYPREDSMLEPEDAGENSYEYEPQARPRVALTHVGLPAPVRPKSFSVYL